MTEEVRLSRPLRYDTFPYRCELNALDFQITEFALNDDSPISPEDGHHLDLDEYGGWETAHLTLEVELPSETLQRVFPDDSPHPGKIVVAMHCVDTYRREGTILNGSEGVEPGTVSDTFDISADKVAGTVELHPYLVRSSPLEAESLPEDHDFATEAGEMLADGRDCTVLIEEEEPGSDDLLSVDRTSFEVENEDEESVFPPEDRLYFLDLIRDPDNPVLYFNEDYERIVDIVWNAEDRYDELTEDIIWDQVMTAVWSRMVQVAATEYEPDSDTWTPEWHPAVFEAINDHLYPQRDTTPERAAEFLKEDLSEDTLSATERIESAVQGVLDPAQQFDNHISRLGDS